MRPLRDAELPDVPESKHPVESSVAIHPRNVNLLSMCMKNLVMAGLVNCYMMDIGRSKAMAKHLCGSVFELLGDVEDHP